MAKAQKRKRFKITKSGLWGKSIILLVGMVLLQNNNLYSQSKDSSSKKNSSIIPQVGLNIARISISEEFPDGVTNSVFIGYNVGITGEILATNALAVNVGLSLCNRGGAITAILNKETSGKIESSLLYLDIPIGLKYYIWKKNNFKFFIHAGVYLGIAIIGNVKSTTTSGTRTTTSTEDDVFGENGYKRIDIGINAGIGAEFKRIQLILNNQIGIANINANSSAKSSRHYVFSISLGYRLFGK